MSTPYELVSAVERPRQVRKRHLVALSRRLEQQALREPPQAMAAALQDARFLTERTLDTYRRIASEGVPVTLAARGLPSWLAPGVRGLDLDEEDPLVDQWVVVLAARGAPAVLAATDLGGPAGLDLDRGFEFAVSHDEHVVLRSLQALTGQDG